MSTLDALPILCTLSTGEFRERIASIDALARVALRSCTRRGLELELCYAASAAGRVREMVALEQQCCAFLQFDVDEEADSIRVTITAPESARAAADELFSRFAASIDPGSR